MLVAETFDGKKLKAFRLKRGWSPERVAQKLAREFGCGFVGGTLRNWERGLTFPPAHAVAYLSALYGVKEQTFFVTQKGKGKPNG